MTDTPKRRARRTIAEQRAEHEARIERAIERQRVAEARYVKWQSEVRDKHEAALAELKGEK